MMETLFLNALNPFSSVSHNIFLLQKILGPDFVRVFFFAIL